MEPDWSSGSEYTVGWWVFIFFLFPTFVFNLGTFLIITHSPRLHTSSNALLVRYLAVEDGAFALGCLVQCGFNLGHGGMMGGSWACHIQAGYFIFCSLSIGYTLCCIAYNSEQKIGFKSGLSERQVLYVHLVAWTVAAVVSVVMVTIEPVRLIPSGTYCLPAMNKLGPLLLIETFGTGIIVSVLFHRYYLMWRHIKRHTDGALSAWEQHRVAAQARQTAIAKRVIVIILVYNLCYGAELSLAVYEFCSGVEAPATAHLVSGSLVHLNSLLNPVLYVYCNSSMRTALWETFTRGSRHRIAPISMLSSSPQPETMRQLVSTVNKGTVVVVETSPPGSPVLSASPIRSPSVTAKKLDRTLPPVRTFKLKLSSPTSPSHGAVAEMESPSHHPFQPELLPDSLSTSIHYELASPGRHSQVQPDLELQ